MCENDNLGANKKKTITLSVIIPVFNGQDTVENCIKNVLCQLSADSEVIVIDDGSTDKSNEICSRISREDNRVLIIRQDNGGVSSARNKGIKAASGKYIMFIDCDDVITEGYFDAFLKKVDIVGERTIVLSRIMAHYSDRNIDVLEGDNLDTETLLSIDRIVDIWDNHLWNSPVNKIYNGEIVRNNHIRFDANIKIGEDWLFNNDYVRAIVPESFYIIKDAVYDYYIDSDPWRHCRKEEFYEINKNQVNDFKYTLNTLNIDRKEIEKFNKRDLDFTITEIRRIARDRDKMHIRIGKIRKLMLEETFCRRFREKSALYSVADRMEFSFGSPLLVLIWEGTRKKVGILRRKVNG